MLRLFLISKKRLGIYLCGLQIFIGVGAIAGGIGLVADPQGHNVGMSLEALRGSPFSDYFIPGLVLLTVNGIGHLVGAWLSVKKNRFAGKAGVGLGVFLMCWIIAQVYWIGYLHWLQPLYFGLGVFEAGLGFLLLRQRDDGSAL